MFLKLRRICTYVDYIWQDLIWKSLLHIVRNNHTFTVVNEYIKMNKPLSVFLVPINKVFKHELSQNLFIIVKQEWLF